MLDKDLADLYQVETKRLNEQVKRNIDRFPEDFMFQLTDVEIESLRSQNATLDNSTRGEHTKYLPYVFTEQGVACLSGILKSKKAIEINLEVIRTFVNLRKFITNNSDILLKIDNLEQKQIENQINNNSKFDEIFKTIKTEHIKPKQGIFYNGQIFDAYVFIIDLLKQAKKEITLIDNYIDETTLNLFTKVNSKIKIKILTNNTTHKLKLDVDRYNSQYNNLTLEKFKLSHDKFLIIDNQVYHIGASLKDLGNKWFAFSKLENLSLEIISKLEKE